MRVAEALALIEGCRTLDELTRQFQRIVEGYGFSSYALLDVGTPNGEDAFLIPTSERRWSDEYRSHGFVHHDPVLSRARRSNVPFTWSDVPASVRLGKRKPEAMRLMEAARDHGYKDGLVIPVHVVDRIGRSASYSCGFFWRDRLSRFRSMLVANRAELHVILIYWAQVMVDLTAAERDEDARIGDAPALSDREREALAHAARGKTAPETAVAMACSVDTVETYLRRAMRKLGTANKTQAAVLAFKYGLIDV